MEDMMDSEGQVDSTHQLWDKLFKVIGDRFPDQLIRFVLRDSHVKLCGKYEQEKIAIEYQIADINFWILDRGERKLLNIEPYSSWDALIPVKVFTRNGIITKSLDYKYEVISVVVLLEKGSRSGRLKVSLGKKTTNRFLFPVVTFKDLGKILRKYPPLAPFVLKIDRSYQDKVIEVVKGDKILTAITVMVLSRLNLPQKEALKMLGSEPEEFKQALLEVPIMQDVFKEWGEKAEIKGELKALVKILKKLGDVPEELHQKLQMIDSTEKLDGLLDLALSVTSIDEFVRQAGL